ALHLRLREPDARGLHDLASELAADAREHGGWCVVNERLDVALAADVQGAQMGSGALPIPAARSVAGEDLVLGASAHDPAEVRRARRDGADFVLLGTIYATPTHPEIEPSGVELVEACRGLGVPVVAIGGMEAGRVAEVRRAGADGVAAVRAVWDAGRPAGAARVLIDEFVEAR
ncbi:MAG: thiamine phosphate synthase, partial [Gemmatimonadota bacterium]